MGGKLEDDTNFFCATYILKNYVENTALAIAQKFLELIPTKLVMHFSVIISNGIAYHITGYLVNSKQYGKIKVSCYLDSASRSKEFVVNNYELYQ